MTAALDTSVPEALRKPGRRLGYARVSTNDQHPEAQELRLIADGCTRVWTDKGASGKKASRPAWDELLDELRAGDTLVIVKLDRAGRSVANLVEVVRLLDERGVAFRVLDQAIDTSTPTGRLLFHMLAAIAEFERDLIIERTRDGQAFVRAGGNLRRSCGGPAPLGLRDPGPLDDDSRDWITDPAPAAMLARVAQLMLPPHPEPLAAAFAVERASWDEPMTDSYGHEVNEKMIRSALRRPASAGLIDADDDAGVIAGPPLDVETFRRLRALFASRARPGRITSDADPYWAGPLLVCANCGNQLTGTRHKPRGKKGTIPGAAPVTYYRCKNRHKIGERDGRSIFNVPCQRVTIRAEHVNELIGVAVAEWRDSSTHYALAARRQEGVATARAQLSNELSAWRASMDDLLPTQAYTSRSAFVSARDEIVRNVERVERELSALDSGDADVPDVLDDFDELPGPARRRLAAEVIVTPIRVHSATKTGPNATPAGERIELLPYVEVAA